jgi:hypothetical protein
MKAWAEDMLTTRLPLHVDEVKICPDDITLSTQQCTEGLGYKQENAIDMITMGCYNTLDTIHKRLTEMDEQGRISFALAKKRSWMRKDPNGAGPVHEQIVYFTRSIAHGLKTKA